MKRILEKLKLYALPALILLFGAALMLMPSSSGKKQREEGSLAQALSLTQGVGEAYVLASENGVVVVCDGADNASVRLRIIMAVKTYTGFGADQITVLRKGRQ